ncbi:conserved hypothetical protein [Desulfamplus magnetovallimortis]|uniref:Uncharacterized protein n=1 Tax=Desulfamplus magnetovallimortis TaxID=1246637 RepID=A0A1W1HDH7_9BACT|nr:conserved hypothetical protein [Desulfamplus magnetovallimortis]
MITLQSPKVAFQKRGAMNKYIKRDRFDFEIGYLTQSPCLKCKRRKESPKCQSSCKLINTIRTILAAGISCQVNNNEI